MSKLLPTSTLKRDTKFIEITQFRIRVTHDLDTAAQIHCIVFADISLRTFCGHSEKLHTSMGWCWRHLVRRIWVTNEINSHVIVLDQFIYRQSMYELGKTDVHDWSVIPVPYWHLYEWHTIQSVNLTSRQQMFFTLITCFISAYVFCWPDN